MLGSEFTAQQIINRSIWNLMEYSKCTKYSKKHTDTSQPKVFLVFSETLLLQHISGNSSLDFRRNILPFALISTHLKSPFFDLGFLSIP